MKELFSWLGFLILYASIPYGMYLLRMYDSTTLLILVFFCIYYNAGRTTAQFKDRRRELSTIGLPDWKRRVLFLNQPNPFYKKTIIFQSTLVIFTPIVVALSLFAPFSIVMVPTLIHCIGMAILAIILEVQVQVGTDYHLDKPKRSKRR